MYLNEHAAEYTIPQEEFEELLETVAFLRRHHEKTLSKEHGWGNALMAKAYEEKDLENEKLKEEIEELKTSLQTTTSYWMDKEELLKEKIITHQDEVIEHLKTIKKLRLDEEKLVEAMVVICRDSKKLKEEKDELRRWVDRNQAEIDRLRLVIEEYKDPQEDGEVVIGSD